ncbi:MAG TPA: ABC transporter permease [Alphaproteobacteria bacterium]|nr:ABC transporter permease [Alphaproteobacteria bacterium]
MESLLQDIRFGLRILRKNPGFASVAILVMALGIGATTSVFSLVNSILLRPLPFADPDRLVMLRDLFRPDVPVFMSYPRYLAWKGHPEIFEQVAAYNFQGNSLTGRGEPEQLMTMRVSSNYLSMLGMTPSQGRNFTQEEERRNAGFVTVISYSFWRSHFPAGESPLGAKLTLTNHVYTIIGVLPQDYRFGNPALMLPLNLDTQNAPPGLNFLGVFAKLRPNVSLAQAIQATTIAKNDVDKLASRTSFGLSITPLKQVLVGDTRTLLLVLLGAVGVLLIIACANTANLLLARAAAREKEIAIRVSLGAARSRVLGQLLTESLLLALIAGGLGLALAWYGVDLVSTLLANRLPNAIPIHMDGYVMAFALLASVATGVLFGLAPAAHVARTNLQEKLSQGGRSSSSAGTAWVRNSLIVGEIALSLVLLVGAGLLLRSFMRLLNVDMGFNPSHVLTMQVYPSPTKYADPQKESSYLQQILERAQALPGVKSAALTGDLPVTGRGSWGDFTIEGHATGDNASPNASKQTVIGNFFEVMQIPIIKGRALDSKDTLAAPKVAVINQSLARRYFPNEDPIGKRIEIGWGKPGLSEIVGLVADVKDDGLALESYPTIYFPAFQQPEILSQRNELLAVRSDGDPLALTKAISREIHQLDSEQTIARVKTMDLVVSDSLSDRRAPMWLLGSFSILAQFLAAIGIYGVLSYYVFQRRAEIGVRIALGAQRSDVLRLILGHAARLVAAGLAIGLVVAMVASRALTTMLYGVKPTDAATFFGVSVLLVVLALVACGIPAIRATRVDPLSVLRSE